MADPASWAKRPSELFGEIHTSVLEEYVQRDFLNACDKIWESLPASSSDTNNLMFSVADDFIKRGARNSTLFTRFTSAEDPDYKRGAYYFKVLKDQLQTAVVNMGWHVLTDDPTWRSSDPLALTESNKAHVTWKGFEYTLAVLWNRHTGGGPGSPQWFDFTGVNSFIPERIKDHDTYPPAVPHPPSPSPLPQGPWGPGQALARQKSNFMLTLTGDMDDDFIRFANGIYTFATSPNHNNGGQFHLGITGRFAGDINPFKTVYEVIGQYTPGSDTQLELIFISNGTQIYRNAWPA